ncbi:Na+/H+ antiporter subunit E [Microbacterium sp. Yaish 1]|uniref:Na+/H+ antiporter subunit E n=1 Tax=Microbacterium sp. Yaish 1 TaxID=2025014 RepID=UPI0015C61A9D|nr:Na+/H+ antiporter subunit E [Microbacterium sp. Yaish 1]
MGTVIVSVLCRLVVIGIVWIAATEASVAAFGYGMVAVPVVVATTYALTGIPRRRVGLIRSVRGALGALELASWVIGRSIVGGIDVARRAIWLPRADIDPEWVTHTTVLETSTGRAALALVANLMPGSLTASIDGRLIAVHTISPSVDVAGALASLERRIARIEEAWSVGGGA